MMDSLLNEAYMPALQRIALALAVGLFVGMEREHRKKEAGVRTFAFVSVLGALGGLLGTPYSILALGLIGVLIVLLNIETLRTVGGAEITTSAALMVTAFTGLLAGQGQTITPTVLSVMTAALLAWKKSLAQFSRELTEMEVRSAVLLAILAFVVYPVLPEGSVDPWNLIVPRTAWVTVILIAALGYVNYLLLKMYGDRGLVLTGFFGGLVNSKVASTELATRANEMGDSAVESAYQGIILSNGSMLIRNVIVLGVVAPFALLTSAASFALMLAGTAVAVFTKQFSRNGNPFKTLRRQPAVSTASDAADAPIQAFDSPFSVLAAIRFGVLFLTLQVVSTIALREWGESALYAVSIIGGFLSSASAVASAANLAAHGEVPAQVAALSVVLASVSSLLGSVPFVARLGKNRSLTARVAVALTIIAILGIVGAFAQGFITSQILGSI